LVVVVFDAVPAPTIEKFCPQTLPIPATKIARVSMKDLKNEEGPENRLTLEEDEFLVKL
jgi:hypothetical protein